ncbi:MAG TPA: hypothetical protein VF109_10330 [Mycobacteriales bacterium]
MSDANFSPSIVAPRSASSRMIAAYFSGLGDNGDSIAVKVLELVVKKFAK